MATTTRANAPKPHPPRRPHGAPAKARKGRQYEPEPAAVSEYRDNLPAPLSFDVGAPPEALAAQTEGAIDDYAGIDHDAAGVIDEPANVTRRRDRR